MIPLHMIIIYSILYWAIQILSWIFIPYLQSYVVTGEIGTLRKIWGGFVDNFVSYCKPLQNSFLVIYFSILGGGAIALVVYIMVSNLVLKTSYPLTL
jgi:hypothetical protein